MGQQAAQRPQPDATARATIHPPISSILDALTFQLARLVAINYRNGSHWFRKEHDLSLNEWRVLGLTRALEPVTVQNIRNTLLMDKGQLSRVVKQLSARGLIRSAPSAADARAVVLTTTATGQQTHDKVLAFTAERNEAVVAPLTPQECDELMRLLAKISSHNIALDAEHGLAK